MGARIRDALRKAETCYRTAARVKQLFQRISAPVRARILASLSLAVRTGTTLGTFALLARFLGPHDFGLFSTAIAYSTIAALGTDFGFSMKVLRDVGADPSRAGEIIAGFLRVKLCLTAATTVIAAAAILLLDVPVATRLAVAALYAATILISYGDLALLTFRGTGAFAREAVIVLWTSLAHAAIVVTAVVGGAGLDGIAVAYFVSRALYVFAAMAAVRRNTAMPLSVATSRREVCDTLASSAPFALDTVLTVIYGQFDAVMVSSLAGLHAAGIYMAGARLVTGVLPLTSVLAGVQIPVLSKGHAAGDPGQARRMRRSLAEFAGIGLVVSASMLVAGPLFVTHLYGPAYVELNQLWPSFALFTLARFVAAGMGVQLVAVGRIKGRIFGTAITTAATFAAFAVMLPRYGVAAAPWLMAAGMLLLCLLYGRQLIGDWRGKGSV